MTRDELVELIARAVTEAMEPGDYCVWPVVRYEDDEEDLQVEEQDLETEDWQEVEYRHLVMLDGTLDCRKVADALLPLFSTPPPRY